MKNLGIYGAFAFAGLLLGACNNSGTTPADPPGDGRLMVCPADQMQDLVGHSATEAGAALGKVPAEARTPTYYIGTEQKLPDNVLRGSTLVKLNAPIVRSGDDLSQYTIDGVYCFTGKEWAN